MKNNYINILNYLKKFNINFLMRNSFLLKAQSVKIFFYKNLDYG